MIPKGADAMVSLRNYKNLKEQKITWIPRTSTISGTIVEHYLADEQYRKRMHEQGDAQTDMKEFDRGALERKNYVATPEERRYYRYQYVVVPPNQRGGSNTL